MNATTASTYHGPPITLEAIHRAIAEVMRLQAPDLGPPIRVTRAEMDRMAALLHFERPVSEGFSSLAGIPIVEMPEDSPFVRMFTLQERIERTHPLMRTP